MLILTGLAVVSLIFKSDKISISREHIPFVVLVNSRYLFLFLFLLVLDGSFAKDISHNLLSTFAV